MNGPVTLDVIRKMHKVQDAHMNALLKLFIWLAFFDLTCKHTPHIKKNTLVPAFKVFDLHFHIHPGSVCKQYMDIQNSQLVILHQLRKTEVHSGQHYEIISFHRFSFPEQNIPDTGRRISL